MGYIKEKNDKREVQQNREVSLADGKLEDEKRNWTDCKTKDIASHLDDERTSSLSKPEMKYSWIFELQNAVKNIPLFLSREGTKM